MQMRIDWEKDARVIEGKMHQGSRCTRAKAPVHGREGRHLLLGHHASQQEKSTQTETHSLYAELG